MENISNLVLMERLQPVLYRGSQLRVALKTSLLAMEVQLEKKDSVTISLIYPCILELQMHLEEVHVKSNYVPEIIFSSTGRIISDDRFIAGCGLS